MSEPVIFEGGPIRTLDDQPLPEAVLVERGIVAAVGSAAECRAAASRTPRRVDLQGRCLMPGFVDPHMHLLLHGCRLDWADLSGARSVDEIVNRLRRHGTAHPDDETVSGYGYDHTVLAEGRHPSASDLDRADATRPVAIQHVSGHGFVVSSEAMRRLGISATTPTPEGGRIDRDDTGEPNGLFFDSACDLLTGKEGVKIGNHGPNFHLPTSSLELRRRFDLAQESFLASGITTVCDAQVSELELGAYLQARDEGYLRLRAHLLILSSNLEHLRELGLSSRIGDSWLEILGVKFYADGSVLARTAFLDGECCGGEGGARSGSGHGSMYHEPEELTELLVAAHNLGLPTATHAQGSIPIGLVIDAIEAARALRPRPNLVHRIEHCGFPTDAQIERMARLGIVPVPQPVQLHEHADTIIEDLGPIGGRFYPYGAFERNDVPVVISSDAPVTDPGPLRAAWAAITRESVSGEPAGDADLRVERATALRGITSTGAALLGRPDVGSIAPGAAADLVLLDADPVSVAIEDLRRVGVSETWIGGELAWSADEGMSAARGPAVTGA